METIIRPSRETFLQDAFLLGVLDHPCFVSASNHRELLLKEHLLSCLYWFAGEEPLTPRMLHRIEDVLPDEKSRQRYGNEYKVRGRQMAQARLEGMASPMGLRNFIMPNSLVTPPKFHYPTVALDFVAESYMPGGPETGLAFAHDNPVGPYPVPCAKATIRVREVICLLAIFLEFAQRLEMLAEYGLFLERALFTMVALNPILRLGMPQPFGEFVRTSMLSITAFFYENRSCVERVFERLPPHYYDHLLESLAELANVIPWVQAYSSEDFV